jgi:hypothetical protein
MEKVVDSHENAKEAKRKLQAYKSKIVQAMNEESRELMQRALEEVNFMSSCVAVEAFCLKCVAIKA